MKKLSLIRLVLFHAAAVSLIFAQTDVGRIVGTVSDASGAVIPGANITVKNEKTGEERKVTSSDTGTFIVPQLKPADYTVQGTGSGFGVAEYTKINLQVGQEKTVNVTLQPSSVTTQVNVSGGEQVSIDTDSARMGVNVTNREVAELPLNGRQLSQLYLLTPGATNSGSGNFDNIRFSGRSNQQNEIRYDGVEGTSIVDASPGNLNGETSSPFRLQSSLETVQEFRVESNNYPAEFGTGTGGQISVITRSGGNDFHGSLFEYLRNDYFDARDFFAGAQKNKLRLNQFGGSLGGPIQKDKLFFFGSYEGLRQRIGFPIVETTPSLSARARAVPSIQPLLAAFPIGQLATANPDFDQVNVNGIANTNENQGSIRFDYRATEKFTFYGRYQRDQGDTIQTQNSSGGTYSVTAVPQNAVLNFQAVLTPTMINEFKLGFNGNKTRINGNPPQVPGVDLTGVTVSITGNVALSGIGGQGGSAGVVTPTGLVRANSATNGRGQPYTGFTLPIVDSLSLVKGNHSLKFGFEFRPIRLWTDRQGGTTYTFPSLAAFLTNTPSQIQYLGDVSAPSPFNNGVTGERLAKQEYYVGYAQDEWKLRPNLTINLGLRYEYYTVLREDKNRDVIFNTVTGQLDAPDKPFYETSPNNWGPRVAFTWSPGRFNNRTVFRAGSGFYYGPGQTEDQLQPIESDRISTTLTSGIAYPLNTQQVAANYNINSPTLNFQPRAYAPGYRIPERVLSYTASVQQTLPGDAVLTVAYVGSQGRNLFLRSWTNRIIAVNPTPTAAGGAQVTREFGGRFAEIDYKTSGGRDNYNALQTTLNRRFSRGLTVGSQYTWSHSIGTTGGSNEARTAQDPSNFNADHGDNNFDVRQTFNASALYELPYGRGRRFGASSTGVVDALLGGWQMGSIVNARTGIPIEVGITRPDVIFQQRSTGLFFSSINAAQSATGDFISVINTPGGGSSRNIRRPDVVPGVDPYLHDGGLAFINPAAFSVPKPGTYGNLARNGLHGPNLVQWDLTLDKKFRFSETRNVELRAEFYNILNHTNFANPPAQLTPTLGTTLQPGQPLAAGSAGSGAFGRINSTVSNQVGLGTNRQIQLALRYSF